VLGLWLGAPVYAESLAWDAKEKRAVAKIGDEEMVFVFSATNKSDHPVTILSTATSCHCTVATPPRSPWVIAPAATDELKVTIDLRSRRGGLTKTIYVDTSEGETELMVHVEVPAPPAARREMNTNVARMDRQAVLQGDCATCHVTPAQGKEGADLFMAACGICHLAEHRATMVPDLTVATTTRDAAFWEKWIREGKDGTLMPAFAEGRGGFLSDKQIHSLVTYLMVTLPTRPETK
jgi:mono/diheme cytochrome c family protein